jgi:Tol biopolymer transport system component
MRLFFVLLFGVAVAENVELKTEFGTMFSTHSARGLPAHGKKGVMLMNRIGPSTSELYVSDADGGNERKLLQDSQFEYHASFSADAKWITFTSERNGDGNSDIYRCHPDGSGLEKLVATSSYEGAAVLSPDGSKLAFVSTAEGFKANVWVRALNLTPSPIAYTC